MVRDIKNKPHGPKAAWLCKQNKQLPVTITSTLLSRFAKLGGRDPPHGGERIFNEGTVEEYLHHNAVYWKVMVTFPDSWFNSSTSL